MSCDCLDEASQIHFDNVFFKRKASANRYKNVKVNDKFL